MVVNGELAERSASADIAAVPKDGAGPHLGLSLSRGGAADSAAPLWEQELEPAAEAADEGGIAIEAEAAWGLTDLRTAVAL